MADPVDVFIGKRIREERLKAGLTQVAMAEQIGVKFQQLQKYENAQNRFSGSRIWLVASALGVPVSTFFPPERGDTHGSSGTDGPGSPDQTTSTTTRTADLVPRKQRACARLDRKRERTNHDRP